MYETQTITITADNLAQANVLCRLLATKYNASNFEVLKRINRGVMSYCCTLKISSGKRSSSEII